MASPLILPGDPEFDFTLATMPPPGTIAGGDIAFIARAGSGILHPATQVEVREYLEGGEYDQRLAEIGEVPELWDDEFEAFECGSL